MNEFTLQKVNPIHPCICGHLINAHGEEDSGYRLQWNADTETDTEVQQQPRPICYSCEYDCCFIEMNNLEYVEWKSDLSNKCS